MLKRAKRPIKAMLSTNKNAMVDFSQCSMVHDFRMKESKESLSAIYIQALTRPKALILKIEEF